MRIVVAHNAYRQEGGEDMVVRAEIDLLRGHGHDVEVLARHNDDLERMSGASAGARALWSRGTVEEARSLIRRFRPHVMHVHNTFALLSPSVYWACSREGVPVVQTLHNFRLACPQAMFLRAGRACEECLGRLPLPAVRHACYRGSRAQTAVLAGTLVLHRAIGTWRDKIAVYIALTEFSRGKFIAAGLPQDRLVVKPNFVADAPPQDGTRSGFLFAGRLSHEKGVGTLVAAWRQAALDTPLRVAGSGPEAALLAGVPRLQALGALPLPEVQRLMTRARALVLPSLSFENFPRTLVEAYAARLPVIASRTGALAELVEDGHTGLLFEPGSAGSLAACLAWAHAHPEALARMGERARQVYEARYTPQRNHELLQAVYLRAIRSSDRGAALAEAS